MRQPSQLFKAKKPFSDSSDDKSDHSSSISISPDNSTGDLSGEDALSKMSQKQEKGKGKATEVLKWQTPRMPGQKSKPCPGFRAHSDDGT